MRRYGTYVLSGVSPAAPGDAVIATSSTTELLTDFSALAIYAKLLGATGGPLDLWLQTSYDGALWWDYAHWTQIVAGAGGNANVAWKVARDQQSLNATAIGFNATPGLAAGVVLGGAWGKQLRLYSRAGALTTAGAAQEVTIYGSGNGPSIH